MKNSFVLGLDLGTNSIGWAIVDQDSEGNPCGLRACGTRIFREAVDAKTNVPKNQLRRAARSARKLIKRRKLRKLKVLHLLQSKNLLPVDEAKLNEFFNTSSDPYQLRKKALDEKLELTELGRVFYHFAQRRGFKSNRKIVKKEEGEIDTAILQVYNQIKESGSRTLGEYLANVQKRRGLHTDRKMYEDEFNLIWNTQCKHYPKLLTLDFKIALYKAIFFQRPLKLQKNLVGKCTFEPYRKRAARGTLEYQEFRLLQDINHLKIKNPVTREYREPTESERKKILQCLSKQKTLSWNKARQLLGLHENEIFNLEEGKKKELTGNRTAAALRSILGKQWDDMDEQRQRELVTDMLTIHDDKGFIKRIKEYWGFNDQIAEKLAETELEPGYARLSLKAIRKIIPFLKQGLTYDKACLEAGYNHSSGTDGGSKADVRQLPLPPYIRNPVVQKALFETRRLINAVIRRFGKPAVIRVEMARDMKMTKKEKQDYQKKQKDQEERNRRAKKVLEQEFKIQNPSREDILKYILWEECKMVCPYTGNPISREMLFSPEVEIEHIIPYSRSLDDSYMNKTLCLAYENRNVKQNRTPYEAYHANEEKYQQILQRIKCLPYPKRRRFELKEVDTEQFVTRQLNDTRYICREVKNYLQQIGVSVEVSKGEATARLRYLWSLNSILSPGGSMEKNRQDHRHHAIDAIVIALTSRKLFKKLADISKQTGKALRESGFRVEHPWPTFYDEIKEKVSNIIVSHAATRKISGALHEETAYGFSAEDYFVYRKPLISLTENMVENIRDQKVKQLVKERIMQFGSIKKAFGDENNPLLHVDGKTPIYSVRLKVNLDKKRNICIRDANGNAYKYYKCGNNHHVEIVENITTGKRKGIFVSTLEAAKRARLYKQPIVNREHGDGWRFVMSLCINDMLEVELNGKKEYYRVQKLSDPTVTLRHHTSTSTKDTKKPEVLRVSANTLIKDYKGKKINVDYLGYISPCND